MIKIKLLEPEIHRNETTFRPFIFAQNYLREIGIEFTNSDDYDYAWVGQASIIDKKKSLKESIDKGLVFISEITGNYMIIDGQIGGCTYVYTPEWNTSTMFFKKSSQPIVDFISEFMELNNNSLSYLFLSSTIL